MMSETEIFQRIVGYLNRIRVITHIIGRRGHRHWLARMGHRGEHVFRSLIERIDTHRTAVAFAGDPTPPTRGSGETVSKHFA